MSAENFDLKEMRCIAGLFWSSYRRFPDRPALSVDGKTLSYRDLASMAAGFAVTLDEVDATQQVGVIAYRTATAYAGILGILASGRTYVALNPKFPHERNQTIAEFAELKHIICDPEYLALEFDNYKANQDEPAFITIDDADLKKSIAGIPCRVAAPIGGQPFEMAALASEAPAYIMFTSGTTGKPKGVPITNDNVLAYVNNVLALAPLDEHDRFSQTFDLTFDLSVHDMFVCWAVGACLCVVPDRAVMAPAKFIREQNLTVWFSVPSTIGFMHKLRTLKPNSFPTLRCSWFCGEALPAQSARLWCEAAPNSFVENLYGPTEATIAFTNYRWRGDELDKSLAGGYVPIGRPMGDLEAVIINDDNKLAPPGESGELHLGGNQLTPGYWQEPEKSALAFINQAFPEKTSSRWYRTGDLAKQNDEGNLEFIGRVDSQVKILGYRVELGEIERVVRLVCQSELVAAVAWPRVGASASGVVAFVCGTNLDVSTIINACEKSLPPYMVPKMIYSIEQFPLNANGKIDRGQLEQRLAEG